MDQFMLMLPGLVLVALIVWLVVKAFMGLMGRGGGAGRDRVCTQCGTRGPSRSVTRGSFAIEIVLWLLFIIPGLIYSIWRVSTRTTACAACGATSLVPPDSPAGRRMLGSDGG